MLKAECEKIRTEFEGSLEFDVRLAKYAYYRIGGPAEVVATPRSFAALRLLHSIIQKTQCRSFFLGWGSNLLFSDEGFPGLVIRMKHLFTEIEVQPGQILKLGASLGASQLLREASVQGWGGIAKLTGIPGSVGGMVAMNAGTHLGEIGASLVKTELVSFGVSELKIETRIHEASDFSYRNNHFLKPFELITHTYLKFEQSTPERVKNEIDELYQRRKSTQPVDYPSCGSVFMNPKASGMNAWQVIDRLGLRGYQVGQAQFSEKHPNFIINLGNARASEVKALIELAKARALAELKIELHEEVKFIS